MTVFTNKGPDCRLQAGIDYTKLDELTEEQYRTPVHIRPQRQEADMTSIPGMQELIQRLDTFTTGTLVVISNVKVRSCCNFAALPTMYMYACTQDVLVELKLHIAIKVSVVLFVVC
jgi:hypothetical protein